VTRMQFQPAGAGGWVAIAAGDRALVVGAVPHDGFVASAFSALAEANGLQLALDLLAARGISATPSFALLEFRGGSGALRVILRGDVAVTVDTAAGGESLSGSGVSTWTERDIEGATRVAVSVVGAVAAAGTGLLPLVSGAALVAAIELLSAESDAVPAPAEPAVAPVAQPEPIPAAKPVISPPPVPAPTPVVEPPAPTPASTEFTEITQVAADDSEPDDSEPDDSEPGSVPAQDEPTAIAEREAAEHDEVAERADENPTDAAPDSEVGVAPVVVVDPEDKTVVMPSRRKRPPLAGDHDGHTVVSSDIAELRARRAASETPPPPPAPLVTLVLASGAREPLTQPILVGRAPSVSQVSGGQMPRLLTVGGTDQDISRTHVRFALEGGTVVVTDLHSRNGTTIAMPGKDPQQLRAGEPTSVIVGTVVDLGSGVTFTVDEA